MDVLKAIEDIACGEIPTDIDFLSEAATVFSQIEKGSSQSLAIVLAQVKSYPDIDFQEWLKSHYPHKNKSYVYQLIGCGNILIGLRKCSFTHYKRFFKLNHDQQYAIYPLLKHGINYIINFMNLHLKDDMEKEQIRALRDKFLGIQKAPVAEQLSFQFDLFGDIDAVNVAKIMEDKNFDDNDAITIMVNGATLCQSTAPFLAARPEMFDDEDLENLEDLYNTLNDSANHILKLVNCKKTMRLQ